MFLEWCAPSNILPQLFVYVYAIAYTSIRACKHAKCFPSTMENICIQVSKIPPQILWITGRRKWKPVVFCFGSPLEFKECLSMLEIEVAKLLFSIVAGCVFIGRWTWMRLCGWWWFGAEIGGLVLLARLYGRTLEKKACILMWCHDTYLNEKSWVVPFSGVTINAIKTYTSVCFSAFVRVSH